MARYDLPEYQSMYRDPQSVAINTALRQRFVENFAADDQLAMQVDAMESTDFEGDEAAKQRLTEDYNARLDLRSTQRDYENMGMGIARDARSFIKDYQPLQKNKKAYDEWKAKVDASHEAYNTGKGGLDNEEYLATVSEDSQQWRLNNIVVQLAQLYPACSGYGLLPRNSQVDNYIKDQCVYPPRYSSTNKSYPKNYAEIFELIDKKLFRGFSASKTGINYIQQWMSCNNITSQMVVITLRNYGYDKTRNSNIDEWVKFAHWVKNEGFIPIFVPDTDSCWTSTKELEHFIVFTEPCWNLGLRMAIYELAFVNFFYSNGTSSIGSLNKKIRSIAMHQVIEESLHSKADVINSFGLVSGQRRYNFAEKHQFLIWKQDTFENIRDEFLEFVSSVTPLEKSENVDKGGTSCE